MTKPPANTARGRDENPSAHASPPPPPPITTTTTTTTTSPRHGSAAVRGASLLIVLQIASRAVTFVANQLLLRFLTAQLLGISTQLEVYYLSVLFFARESLRVAIQRQDSRPPAAPASAHEKTSDHAAAAAAASARDSQSVVNIAHLSLLLGLGAALGFGWAYLRYVDAATAATPHLGAALRIYGLAAVVELLSEPAFVILQYRLRFGPRAAAESVATFARCLVTFGTASWASRRAVDLGVLPFAFGQLAYGTGLLAVYAWYGAQLASAERFSLLPKRSAPLRQQRPPKERGEEHEEENNRAEGPGLARDTDYALGYFYKPTLQLASSLTAQSFVKHLLTQGDTFLVSVLSDARSQGIYALANNYGGLLARLVFQPIEESSRNYFSKLLSSAAASPDRRAVARARADLQALLRFYLLLGAAVVAVGPYAAPLLVQVVAGARWSASGAGAVLARYCLYVPLLAVNGVAEAFVASVATDAQVHRQSLWMGAFSLAFGLAGFVSLRVLGLGAAGLVYANAINMLCRILWSAAFIADYFRRHGAEFGWSGVAPSGTAVLVPATAAVWAVLARAGISVGAVSPHVFRDLITVGSVAVPYAAVIAYTERKYLLDAYRSVRSGGRMIG
ncbi:Rft-1-domain-containing protein [Durotheca rogersii]|uniref:Rft-1-domain-containing protein n=1 Tax=Durotheca rogersii TaxID=419775 RepID=UPI002220FA40|nr:Rft-1-domain-containing protein [Durotheca rogersii]KAI5860802.1 Rft-1-domain-containing protein [Durotheca rogersii]